MIPRSPVVRFACSLLLPFAAITLASCERESAAPFSSEPAFAPGGNTAPIEFTVTGPSGAVAGASVRLYNGNGPVTAPALTDAGGFVSFELPKGDYCATVRVVAPEWIAQGLDLVTPATPLNFTTPAQFFVPVVRTSSGYSAFTLATFQDCYTGLYIDHQGGTTEELVTLTAATSVGANLIDPEGNPVPAGAHVYSVLPVCGDPVVPAPPWVDCNGEIKPAFFSFVDATSSPADVVVPNGVPFALEFQGNSGNGFNLTASCKSNSAVHPCVFTSTGQITLETAPLMCVQTPIADPAGEQTIDFLAANVGYHANLALSPDLGVATVELKHTGVGAGSVTFRTDFPGGGRYTSTIDFACTAADGCSTTGVIHTGVSGGVANPQTLQGFYRTLGGGIDKTTIVLTGIPLNHTKLTFSAKSAGDGLPNASKKTSTSAFFEFSKPRTCSVAASNDDKWFVGEI